MNTVREEIEQYKIMYYYANKQLPKRGRMSERLYLAILRNGLEIIASKHGNLSNYQMIEKNNKHTINCEKKVTKDIAKTTGMFGV